MAVHASWKAQTGGRWALLLALLIGCTACAAQPSQTASDGSATSASPTSDSIASISTAPTAPPSAAASGTTGPLSEAEVDTLTGGARVPIPDGAPAPAIAAEAAEATVRATYTGQRKTIGVVRIAMALNAGVRTGWFVALTPADGEGCNLHAGLLARAIEGGVVDDQTGDILWVFVCG